MSNCNSQSLDSRRLEGSAIVFLLDDQFLARDVNFLGGLESKLNLVSVDLQDRDPNICADANPLAPSSRQDKHFTILPGA